jgi:hypothetical protein
MNAAGMLSPESTEEREIAEPLRERAPLAETAEETAEESESAEPLRESAPPPVVDVPVDEAIDEQLPDRFKPFDTFFIVTISLRILNPPTIASPFSSSSAASASAAPSSSACVMCK